MKIIVTEEQLKEVKQLINSNILYSAIFINKDELLKKIPPVYNNNIFYHHSTIEFKPKDVNELPVGRKMNLKVIGRLTTDKVDVLLVDNSLSKNEYPHITLSTNDGIKPYESNKEIKDHFSDIVKINTSIKGVVGYFDRNDGIIVDNKMLKETPDMVYDNEGQLIVKHDDSDAIAFGFNNNKAYIGFNESLFNNIEDKLPSENVGAILSRRHVYSIHYGIMSFNKLINSDTYGDIGGRDQWDYPGRLWYNEKIISFWRYPNKEQLPKLLNLLSNEINKIYNFNINFNDYLIEIKYDNYEADAANANDEDYIEDIDWEFNERKGNLVPIKDFIGSRDASAEEMAKMHVMPSDQKRNTPQMKAALDDKYKIIGKKLGGMPMAKYNHYKRYGMGENINIPVTTGDTILTGKFKNHKEVVKNIDHDGYGMPTINGKKAATFRLSNKPLTEVKKEDVNLSSFELKKELNPKIWDDKKLNRRVRLRLLKIADDFLEFINVDPKYCEDILFLGSLANYNWSKYSDIDLHMLINFKKINKDVELVKNYFDSKRKIWNDEHEMLKIYGFPIEIYIQDINENNESIGVFSVEKNKWISEPVEDMDGIKNFERIKIKSADLMTKIDDLKDRYDKKPNIDEMEKISKSVKSLFDKIKQLRKVGLTSKTGEFSVGNIVFKVLRRMGYIEKLVDLKRNTYDKINTIK